MPLLRYIGQKVVQHFQIETLLEIRVEIILADSAIVLTVLAQLLFKYYVIHEQISKYPGSCFLKSLK